SLLLHYANSKASEQTWRGIVMGPGVTLGDGEAVAVPFGVESLSEFAAVQTELRGLLDRVIALESVFAADARELARQITELARPTFSRSAFSPISEKLFEVWDTENTSFRELVFFTLAQILKTIRFRDVHQLDDIDLASGTLWVRHQLRWRTSSSWPSRRRPPIGVKSSCRKSRSALTAHRDRLRAKHRNCTWVFPGSAAGRSGRAASAQIIQATAEECRAAAHPFS